MQTLTDITITSLPLFAKGKIRHLYDLGETILVVATDRISAYDYILPDGIPDKGKILTAISSFWFRNLERICKNHLITDRIDEFPDNLKQYAAILKDRSMLVRKAKRIDIECVVRGYLSGSAWREYSETGRVGENKLPQGLSKDSKLKKPLFTPTTKAASGHDRPLTMREMCQIVGGRVAEYIMGKSFLLFEAASSYAEERGLTILDTKFEFGYIDGDLVLIDEILTPDSSRFMMSEGGQKVFLDKQYVRDYLDGTSWDHNSPPPSLPQDVIMECRRRYLLILAKLMGRLPDWAK